MKHSLLVALDLSNILHSVRACVCVCVPEFSSICMPVALALVSKGILF